MLSATVRMATFRVEHGVIAGFRGPVKPALVSIYQYLTDIQK